MSLDSQAGESRVFAVENATELLGEYRVGSFFWGSPQRTLLGKGVSATVPPNGGDNELEDLPRRIADVLDRHKYSDQDLPMVMGAVPFDKTRKVQLVVPSIIWKSGSLCLNKNMQETLPFRPPEKLQMIPDSGHYKKGVAEALKRIHSGSVRKIVLSRMLEITVSRPIDIHHLLRNLARSNPQGYNFALDLPQKRKSHSPDGGHDAPLYFRTLIGASPELLVQKSGFLIKVNPLAGSAKRSADPVKDRKHAQELLAASKDRQEHAIVVESVVQALKPYCLRLEVPKEPSLMFTETMWHLSTKIEGELKDPSISSLTLAAAMHPTPAVCGAPTDLAIQSIYEIEPFDREFFTGIVGWCDSNGDGEWAITIRCAEIEDYLLRLYAGAGIVMGSEPEKEFEETGVKLRTMLNALGIGQRLEVH